MTSLEQEVVTEVWVSSLPMYGAPSIEGSPNANSYNSRATRKCKSSLPIIKFLILFFANMQDIRNKVSEI